MMSLQQNCFVSPNYKLRISANGGGFVTVMSKKTDFTEKPNEKRPVLRISVPNTILARSAIVVLGLGFIDAGYSGDWSRIGFISKETEQLLKLAAFLVAPLCLFLALSFSSESDDGI